MKTLPDGLAESKERRRGAAVLCLKIAASIWLKAQNMIAAVVGGEPDISGGVLNGLKHKLSRKLTRLAKLRR